MRSATCSIWSRKMQLALCGKPKAMQLGFDDYPAMVYRDAKSRGHPPDQWRDKADPHLPSFGVAC